MNNIFGNRLRNLRISENITGVELGKILNVTKVAISNWESGKRTPDQETLTKIADYFDVTTDYLLGRTDNKKLTVKDEKSIQKDLKDIINDFKSGQAGPAFFNGQELSEKDLEVLEVGMEAILTTLKIQNKEKYTPKKYKKD